MKKKPLLIIGAVVIALLALALILPALAKVRDRGAITTQQKQ
jgi:hypothetical protein